MHFLKNLFGGGYHYFSDNACYYYVCVVFLVEAICENTADTFYCETTLRRISCSKWRDSVYSDCGGTDYSDESKHTFLF